MRLLILIIIAVNTIVATSNIKNGGFEQWDSLFVHSYSETMIELGEPEAQHGIVTDWIDESWLGIAKTPHAYSGNSALLIHHWYAYAPGVIEYHAAAEQFNTKLSGYYKLTNVNNTENKEFDPNIRVFYTRNANSDTVAYGEFNFTETEDYKYFELEIEKIKLFDYDSVIVRIASENGFCKNFMVCNFLYIDDLQFGTSTSVEETKISSNDIMIYPNPTSSFIHWENSEITDAKLLNNLGTIVYDNIKKDYTDLSNLPNGIYYLRLMDINKNIIIKKIVKI